VKRIQVAAPVVGQAEARAAYRAVRSGWVARGPEIPRFERAFARAVGAPAAAAVSSGTAALEAAVRALDLAGAEVITGAASCNSTANALLAAGCRVVLVDHDPADLQMSVEATERAVTRRTRAIVAVHLYGHPSRIDALAAVARRRGLALIEDCAQALGARLRGRPVGTFGDAAVWSLYANKGITTGEGGVVTGPRRTCDRVRLLRNHGQAAPFVHVAYGGNWKMTNVQAAIGLAQLRRLPALVRRRRAVVARLRRRLAGAPAIVLPAVRPDAAHAWFCFPVLLRRGPAAPVRRRLERLGVETRPLFAPQDAQPYWRREVGRPGRHPVASDLHRRGFYVSTSPALTDRDVDRLAAAIRRAV
jgi:perosamine synthetase